MRHAISLLFLMLFPLLSFAKLPDLSKLSTVLESQKELEMRSLNGFMTSYIRKISGYPNLETSDYLDVFPDFSISQQRGKKYEQGFLVDETLTLWSATFRISSWSGLKTKEKNKDKKKRDAINQVESCYYSIKSMINQKYLMMNLRHNYERSVIGADEEEEDPIKIFQIQEKMLELDIKIEKMKIEIEKEYALMKYHTIDAE